MVTTTRQKLARGLKSARDMGKMAWSARNMASADANERERARRVLSQLMADARGIPMKIGQVLAGSSTDSPFQQLTSGIDPLPLETVTPLLARAWGCDPSTRLESLEPSQHAASLGQVHRGRLRDGREVAIKIQYPDIAGAIDAQLQLAGLMPGLGPVRKWGFDLDGYRRELRANLLRELDYAHEAQIQLAFAKALAEVPGLVIPQVLPALSTPEVLVQTWESGQPFSAAATWSPAHRQQLAHTLIRQFMASVFGLGEFHGDLHFGNLAVRLRCDEAELIQHDFGCTIALAPVRRTALLRLICAVRDDGREPTDILDGFCALGFEAAKLGPIAAALPSLARVLLRPFTGNGRFPTQSWRLAEDVNCVLGEDRWWFRSAGPPELFLMLRAFQGLVTQLEFLEATVDWWAALDSSVPAGSIEHARRWVIPRAAHDRELDPHAGRMAQAAQRLHVRICESGREKVSMSMPATSVLELAELIPDEVAQALAEREIDIDELRAQAVRHGLQPSEIFQLDLADKHYRVWLA